ncbi:MAG: hypothetical protein RIE59_05825 [Imperialibacter sp.]
MNFITKIVAFSFLVACKPVEYIYFPPVDEKFSINECGYFGNTKLTHELFPSKKEFKFIGYYAIDNYGSKSFLKIKECSEFYEDGNLKSRGEYQIGSYTQCCMGGPCEQYYNYKVGNWKYYFPNQQLRAECTYGTKLMHIGTSCEGGDSLKFNIVETVTAYNELGQQVQPTDDLLFDINTISYRDYEISADSLGRSVKFRRK